jgi:glycosyltransferase involved in cell wall biosynthesis
MNLPLVSIIIPVYNGVNYLRETIESALAQTYSNIEIIVINDGSRDETESIALSYGDKIKYFKKENGGVASALNLGISKMRGEFFSWLSHDDLYKPDKIELQIREARKYSQKTMIWCNFYIIDENAIVIDSFKLYDENKKSDAFIILSTYIHGCSLLVPASVFEEIGLFNEKLMTVQDNEMWIRVLKGGYKFVHMQEKLIYLRRHTEQGQVIMKNQLREEMVDWYMWAIDYLDEDQLPSKEDLRAIFLKKGIEEFSNIIIKPRNSVLKE